MMGRHVRTDSRSARARHRILGGVLLLAVCAGCVACPPVREANRRALLSIPEVPDEHLRADRAIVAAFFAANGIPLSADQAGQIIPSAAPQGCIDRHAIQRVAAANNRRLMVLKAGERYLGEELGDNLPLLVLLPPDNHFRPSASAFIVVAWDRENGAIELLDGNGEIQTLPEADFFSRREPLKHAALCLAKAGGLRRFDPPREQKLLLADFWFDQGFYRQIEAPVSALIEEAVPLGNTVESLMDSGKMFFRKQRYKDAIAVFRAALVLEPDNPVVLNYLAFAMLNSDGALLTALRHATKAHRLDPHNPVVLETLGSINLRIGDAAVAVRCLEQAWARALRRSPEIQIAIMDQLVRAWLAADRQDLARQVADYRHRTFPEYRFPKDILCTFPFLRQAPRLLSGKNIVPEGG